MSDAGHRWADIGWRAFGAIAACCATVAAAGGQTPTPDRLAGKPAVFIDAPQERVHQLIAERTRARGFDVTSLGRNGLTIERPVEFVSGYLARQCGQPQPGRVFRIRFVTASIRSGTAVTEDRYMVDPGRPPCRFRMSADALNDRNDGLDSLKRYIEGAGPSFFGGGSPNWFAR